MFYIHDISCISPQGTFLRREGDGRLEKLDLLKAPAGHMLAAIEPGYGGIPANVLRRMGKSVRLGVGAALPLLQASPEGILIGTGYGGMEDSVKFLKQIIEYDEGVLTPGTFIQSTANAVGSQIGLFSHNRGYNLTYVHRGLAFESALIDAGMLVKEQPGRSWLVGGVDEISGHNFRFEQAEGWYKKEDLSGKDLYAGDSPGSIAGEGAALFILNDVPAGALARVKGLATFQGQQKEEVGAAMASFFERHLAEGIKPDLLLSGENGDSRVLPWYRQCEDLLGPEVAVARFKHLCGEYPTASAFALWLACSMPDRLPGHVVKSQGRSGLRSSQAKEPQTILIYNNYKFSQHSLILLERYL